MNLSDLFEETTTGALPPTRVDVETVYRAGVRRRRIGLATRAALVVLPIVALIAALIVVLDPAGHPETADRPPSKWVVHQVGGFNQQRLWAYIEPCPGCGFELRTSDNGGRTWMKYVVQEADLRERVMTTGSGGVALVVSPSATRISTDGWGSFQQLPFRPEPVVAPSKDSPVYCNTETYEETVLTPQSEGRTVEDTGTVRIVDILRLRFGPAPAQPPFFCRTAVRTPDGMILAAGQDPGTGRPVVARSFDDGSTWETKVFEPDQQPASGTPLVVTDLIGSTGGAAVVRFQRGSWTGLYRYGSGTWLQLYLSGRAPDHIVLTGDNTLVAQTVDGGNPAFTVNRPGGTGFQPTGRPAGIGPEPILGSMALPGGGYVAFNDNHIWTSADGRSWKAVGLG